MDNDVLKALHNAEIDRNAFPCVFNWYNAAMKFTLEERSRYFNPPPPPLSGISLFVREAQKMGWKTNFLQYFLYSFPQAVVTRSIDSPIKPHSPMSRTPLKDLLPKSNAFHLKPSKLTY